MSDLPTSDTTVTIVDWDGENDPAYPQNWSSRKKVINGVLVSVLAFLTPLASSILAPGVPGLMKEFGSSSPELSSFVVSVFVLGFAAGPPVMAPMSELYGRRVVYHVCNLGFIAFTVGTAVAPSLGSLIAFRFLSGIFGSAPVTNGGGTIADMVKPAKRGRAMSAVLMGPMLGPIIGPIAGGFLAKAAGWRWICWLVVIVGGLVAVLMLVLADETFAPTLLKQKARRLQKEAEKSNDGSNPAAQYRSTLDTDVPAKALFQRAITRPLRLLVLSPVCTIFAIYMAVVYGYLYILFTSLTTVFTEEYGFSTDMVGLLFLGIGLGSVCGVALFSLTNDKYASAKASKGDGTIKPEYRLALLPFGGLCLPVSLFIYGWTVEHKVHWIVPVLSHVPLGVGLVLPIMCVSTYMVESFTIHAASALAANTIFRSIGGAVLPLVGLRMYDALGMGWGNSVLGFIALATAVVPFLLIRFGERLRLRFAIKEL